jgi:hypothetical protein
MSNITYGVYPPAETGFPWLAVVLNGGKPVETFGCLSREAAERILFEMKVRTDAKNGCAYAQF